MSKVRSSGTDIECLLLDCVRPLWNKEHYRKNPRTVVGKPDIVFPRSKVAVFADGDFWHGNGFDKWGKNVPDFWKKKIGINIARDLSQTKALKKEGYTVLRFWGSHIKKHPQDVTQKVERALIKNPKHGSKKTK